MVRPASMSRDGKMRSTLRINYRGDVWQWGAVLCMAFRDWTHDDPEFPAEDPDAWTPPELTKDQVEEQLRDQLYNMGMLTEGWADDMGDTEQDRWTAWSHRQVRKLWPELADDSVSVGPEGGE